MTGQRYFRRHCSYHFYWHRTSWAGTVEHVGKTQERANNDRSKSPLADQESAAVNKAPPAHPQKAHEENKRPGAAAGARVLAGPAGGAAGSQLRPVLPRLPDLAAGH